MNFFEKVKLRLRGKRLRHVRLLKKLRKAISGVSVIDVVIPVHRVMKENIPGCLLASCHKAGVVDADLATHLQWPNNFSEYFGCTREEATVVIFGTENLYETKLHHKTSADYAKAITALLVKYNYE